MDSDSRLAEMKEQLMQIRSAGEGMEEKLRGEVNSSRTCFILYSVSLHFESIQIPVLYRTRSLWHDILKGQFLDSLDHFTKDPITLRRTRPLYKRLDHFTAISRRSIFLMILQACLLDLATDLA